LGRGIWYGLERMVITGGIGEMGAKNDVAMEE